jgi:uncharacterized SAM-binding protein YcdF (DUF218 family)
VTTAIPPQTTAPDHSARHRIARGVFSLIVVLVVALLVGMVSIAFRVWWVARADDHVRSDVIVVLGASQYDGTPSPILEARLAHALSLYEDGVAPTIVTVGGKLSGDRYTEAAAGKNWLVDNGVPAEDVIAIGKGRDTWRSLSAVDAVMEEQGWTSAVLVTDPWHAFRSREMARHLGVDVTTSPTRTGPVVAERVTELRYVARETGAYLGYQWQRLTGALPS